MRLELTVGDCHLVRFPVERRQKPSLQLLHDIAPREDHVTYVIESFCLKVSIANIRNEAMQGMTSHIATHNWPDAREEMDAELADILEGFVTRAIEACIEADKANHIATTALTFSIDADAKGDIMASVLRAQADTLTTKAARRLVKAHMRIEEANGIADAIDYEKRAKQTGLLDTQAAGEWLCEAQRQYLSRQ
jgi:hypothetical protein